MVGFSKQAFYARKTTPVTERDWSDAHLINAALDVHRDDPAFGYRFIADGLEDQGFSAEENRVARLCSSQQIWSIFAKKRGLTRKSGPPVHDDHVRRDFTATASDQLWLQSRLRSRSMSATKSSPVAGDEARSVRILPGSWVANGLRHSSSAWRQISRETRVFHHGSQNHTPGLRHHPVPGGINSDRRIRAGKIVHLRGAP